MQYRLSDYQKEKVKSIPKRNHVDFVDMVDKIQHILPNVKDIAQSSFEYTVDDIQKAILDSSESR